MKLNQYEWDPEIDLIAEGAFAEVFKAKDGNTTNRYVALKIYKEAVSKGSSVSVGNKKYSLEKEFQNVDGLSHSNIISYFGLDYIKHVDAMGRSTSYAVLIMEYANDGTLTDLMRTKPDKELISKIILDIFKGVRYLHSEGIIHRDLKPGNILITKTRKKVPIAKITDFGISRDTFADQTKQQSMTEGIGTPHYMAPEQIYKKKFGLNGELSNRTDIWALGVIVYRILTGKLPFGSDINDNDYIRELIVNEFPDYSEIPTSYVKMLKACFQKEASKRPKDVDELLQLIGDIDIEKTVFVSLNYKNLEKTISLSDKFLTENEKTVHQANFNSGNANVLVEKTTRIRRVLSWVIDFVISLLTAVIGFYAYYILFKQGAGPKIEHNLIIAILTSFFYFLYYLLPEIKYGKTLGSHILGLRLIDVKKGKIKKSQIIIRNIVKAFTILGVAPLLLIAANFEFKILSDNKSLANTLIFSYFSLLCYVSIVSLILNTSLHNHWANLTVIRNTKGKVDLLRDSYKIRIKPEGKNERIVKYGISGLLLLATLFLLRMTYYENYKFSDIHQAVNGSNLREAKIEGKIGFVTDDFRYKTVVPFKYDAVRWFSEGLAQVKLNDKWGFVDEKGNVVVPLEYDSASDFSEGMASVKLNDKWGFVNKKGEVVIPLEYNEVNRFSEGLAGVGLNYRFGFVDKKGEIIIPLEYGYVDDFSEGLASVSLADKNGFINKKGIVVISMEYDKVGAFSNGLASVKLNDKCGFIDKTGKVVIPLKYEVAYDFKDGKAYVKYSDEWIYIDENGNFVDK